MMEEQKLGLLIEQKLDELADVSQRDGYLWRAGYTKEDAACRALIRGWMEEAGLEVREDAVGNLFGRLKGKDSTRKIVAGSHVDSVINGGKYDGACGVISALHAVEKLSREGFVPDRDIEVAAMVEEEGSRFFAGYIGSRAINGTLLEEELQSTDAGGVTLEDAMRGAGCDPEGIAGCRQDNIDAYVELHIEQGPFLDRTGARIGAVENIVGIVLLTVRVEGEQNHAGATPMNMRKDPALASMRSLTELREELSAMSDSFTFTVGHYRPVPGIHNVIPAAAEFTIDLRAGDQKLLDMMREHIQEKLFALEKEGFAVSISLDCNEKAVRMDESLVRTLCSAAEEQGYQPVRMNSGAGHDAQVFAVRMPAVMIFIPSVNGVSHSPLEYTRPEDMGAGCLCLAEFLKKITE